MKALNLDDLVAERRTVTLFGKEHDVIDMTVEKYLETVKAAENMDENTSMDVAMDASIDVVLRCIPTLTKDALKQLSLKQLGAIIKFARGGYDDEAVAEEGEKQEKKPVKKVSQPRPAK